jgi:hypothetical protein
MTQGVQQGVASSLAALNGLGAQFRAAGANAMGQLAAGIRSKQGEVSAAATAAASTVAAKFPQSPAREGPLRRLPYMGAEIVRQLAGGMANTSPVGGAATRVAAQIAELTGAGPGGAGGGPAMAGAASRGGGGITVNLGGINVTGGSDPQQTADRTIAAIEEKLVTSLRTTFGDFL